MTLGGVASADLNSSVEHSMAAFRLGGMRVLARVPESPHAMDLAFADAAQRSILIRCVTQARKSDYRALKTMLAEGDFDRAILVYCDAEQPHLSDEIESWAIGDVEKLAASLAHWAQAS